MTESLEGGGRAERNGAAFSDVSGGVTHPDALMEALNCCGACDRLKHFRSCVKKLTDYIEAHGHLKSYTECPSYGKA